MPPMNPIQKIAVALVRDALGFAKGQFDYGQLVGLDQGQWRDVYRFTVTHFVTALAFSRVSQLPLGSIPPRGVLIEWMVHADKVAEDNRRIAAATNALVALLADKHIPVIVMKGAGVAACYPDPSLREASDVDIFLGGKFAQGNEAMRSQGIDVEGVYSEKHNEFIYKGVLFENHCTFVDANLNATERRVEEMLHRILEQQGTRRIPIDRIPIERGETTTTGADPGGAAAVPEITIPGVRFNALHVARHMATHFAGGIILLRHLCDWTCMVQAGQVDFAQLRRDDPGEGFIRFMEAVTGICIDHLGLAAHLVPDIKRDEVLEARILSEILASDCKRNFHEKGTTALSVIRYKAVVYFRRSWKHKLIYGEHPLMRAVHTVRAMVARPARILHK